MLCLRNSEDRLWTLCIYDRAVALLWKKVHVVRVRWTSPAAVARAIDGRVACTTLMCNKSSIYCRRNCGLGVCVCVCVTWRAVFILPDNVRPVYPLIDRRMRFWSSGAEPEWSAAARPRSQHCGMLRTRSTITGINRLAKIQITPYTVGTSSQRKLY